MGRALLLGLAAALSLGAAGPRSARAGEAAEEGVSPLLEKLARCPSPDAVRSVVEHAKVAADAQWAQAVVERLSQRGGAACGQGLLRLVRHGDAGVRALALRGVARLRIRFADGIDDVRKCLRDPEADVRAAAFDAMGALADASDVAGLVEGITSDCPIEKCGAYRALLALTGLRIAPEQRRWRDWWATAEKELPPRVASALADLLAEDADEAARADARVLLARYAWADLAKVRDAARECLRSRDVRLRTEGYRVA